VAAARTRVVRAREQLFHKGDEGRHVYVIVRGKLKALTTSLQGDDVVFNIQGPGEMLGEIALLAGQRRTATITAIDNSELLMIERRDFIDCLRRNSGVALKLLQVMAERLKRLSELVEDTLFLNLPVRLAKKLLAFAESDGEKTAEGLRIQLRLSQEEWGDLVGATRESINKQIRAWADEGLIAQDRGHIVLIHPQRLESIARLSLDPPHA
jgi:CRP/FNR family cyclic AMP-dependent transcriptional regulator